VHDVDRDHQPPFSRIAAQAAARHGLVTTSQLRALDLTPSAIGRMARSGLLVRMTQGVYRVPPYPDTWEQRLLACVLAGPPGTVASHRSAARLHELRGCRSDLVEVTCRRWAREHRAGYRVHESLDHDPADTIEIRGIPVTALDRTLVDLGAVLHPIPLGRALDEARRRGQIDLTTVEHKVEERAVRGRNGIAIVRELVAERQGQLLGTTGFEDLVLGVVDDFGLPRPELQWRVSDGPHVAFLDFAYPEARVAIEADSEEYHLDLETFHKDRSRQNWISLLGWSFLRFTARHLRHERRTVAAHIAAALGQPF
jgi:Transcriptional regulator, AbiEi antitoxin/Protein of unknown function (DUF559)